ncbi:hypothetical protein LINPERHAP2_LOCUS31080 [Linum perenne]
MAREAEGVRFDEVGIHPEFERDEAVYLQMVAGRPRAESSDLSMPWIRHGVQHHYGQ